MRSPLKALLVGVAAGVLALPSRAHALPGVVDFSFFRGPVRVWSYAGCDGFNLFCFDGRVEVGRRRVVNAGESVWAVRAFADGRLTDAPGTENLTLGGAGSPSSAVADFRGTPWGAVLDPGGEFPPEEPLIDAAGIRWLSNEVSDNGRRASTAGEGGFGPLDDVFGASLFAARPLYLELTYVSFEGEETRDATYNLVVTGDRIERAATAVVPEPSAVVLLGAGLGAVGSAARRRRA